MRRSRLHVVGASGSGTTTLARALADYWAVPHADADDYFWVPTSPPFVERRQEAERVALMREVFAPREAWVLSGSMLGWGESIVAECQAVVFLTLDPGRSRSGHEEWLAQLTQPVLHLDSTLPPHVLRDAVLEWNPETVLDQRMFGTP